MAIRIISHYRVYDPDVACPALLHDAVEDNANYLAFGGGEVDPAGYPARPSTHTFG